MRFIAQTIGAAQFLCLSMLLAAPHGRVLATEGAGGYETATAGETVLYSDDLVIKVLVEKGNLGSAEVELGEIEFPPEYRGGGHRHGSIEIFYILSGTMNHVVNGTPHLLTPGTVGIVRPEDTVSHEVVGGEAVRALVIWAPGGEVDRLREVFDERPVGGSLP
jgi:quercetin dioxygenase-like cupin family protein